MVLQKFPKYLCEDCAKEIHKKNKTTDNTLGYGFTFHLDICPICKKEKGVATPQDFGLARETENFD